jgi:hypothetical protein
VSGTPVHAPKWGGFTLAAHAVAKQGMRHHIEHSIDDRLAACIDKYFPFWKIITQKATI